MRQDAGRFTEKEKGSHSFFSICWNRIGLFTPKMKLMKRWIFFLAIALIGLTFSCERDSLTGFGNDELSLRSGGETDGLILPAMKKMDADYELFEVDALPEEVVLNGFKPPKGAVIRMYAMKGQATFLGDLGAGMSYEVHYLPPDENPETDIVEVWIRGQFMGSVGLEALRYVGKCTYYPDGRRESRYEFFYGSGPFENAYGWMAGVGYAKEEGRYMKFTAKGKISVPPLDYQTELSLE